MSEEKKVFKLGLVGLVRGSAFIGFQKHLMAGHISFTGVCEKDPKVLEEMKPKLPKETVIYDNIDDLINSGIDAIILCDFYHEHWKLAIKALDAGITVFSETTAAPSLGACVDLVEAVERNNGKYMLLANCPFFNGLNVAKQRLESNQYGKLIYGDAEYVHPVDETKRPPIDKENLHWRQTLPASYYNMHSLGPLMYISNSVPKRVIGKAVKQEIVGKMTNASKMFVITEMDNGAVFNSTGCVGVGTLGKWYRFVCEKRNNGI